VKAPVITVDGPSGVGKGTLATSLAAELDFHLLDSGALYRALALVCQRHGVELEAVDAAVALAADLDIAFRSGVADEPAEVLLGGEPIGESLRSEACGRFASRLAAIPAVREALLARQQAFRRPPGLVADGRDMGTVVFPDAQLKLFLDASVEERARRRYKQLIAKGNNATLPRLIEEISARDRRDRERSVAPLKPAADAVLVETTGLGIHALLADALAMAGQRGLRRPGA